MHEAAMIATPSTDLKILNALNSMKPLKARSLDGIHQGCFNVSRWIWENP